MLVPCVAKSYVVDEEFDEVEEKAEGGDECVGQDQALATFHIVDEELGHFLLQEGSYRVKSIVAAIVGLWYVQRVDDVM